MLRIVSAVIVPYRVLGDKRFAARLEGWVDLHEDGKIAATERFDKLDLALAVGPGIAVPIVLEHFVDQQRIVVGIFIDNAVKMVGQRLERVKGLNSHEVPNSICSLTIDTLGQE